MGDLLFRARAKSQLYVQLQDLKKKYQDLLNEVPSFNRNYTLWELESQINFTRFRWESIHLPPSFVKQIESICELIKPQPVQEEIHSAEPILKEAAVPNETQIEEICVAEELIIDSPDSISIAKTDLVTGLNGFSRSTSTIDDSANSIDVSKSEEIESVPTDVDDEDDSIDLEMIPQYLFAETQEDEDCLDSDLLVPSFFFKEEEDLPDAVNFKTTEVPSNEDSRENLHSLKEFVSGNHKVISKNRFALPSDFSRMLFDRGKDFQLVKRFSYLAGTSAFGFDFITSCSFALYVCSTLLATCKGYSVHELVIRHGYQSSLLFRQSIVDMLAQGSVISTAEVLFDKMSGNNAVNSSDSVVQMGRVFDSGKEKLQIDSKLGYFHELFVAASVAGTPAKNGVLLTAKRLQVTVYFYLHFYYTRPLFDRGKCTVISSSNYEKLLLLIPGYESASLFHDSIVPVFVKIDEKRDDSKLSVKMVATNKCWLLLAREINLEMAHRLFDNLHDHGISSLNGGVSFYSYFVYTCSLFDRGKQFAAINWFSYISGAYEVTASGLLVFTICSILLAEYNETSACVLVLHHGSRLNLLLMHTIALMLVDSASGDAPMLIVELSDFRIWDLHRRRNGIMLQLKRHLPVGIEVNCIRTFTVIIDGQECEMLQILSKEFKFFMVLNYSVTIVATTYFCLLRIGSFQHSPLLISDVYGKSMVQEGVIMTFRNFSWSSLHTTHCAWYFPSCASQVKALMSLVGTHLMLSAILIPNRWILMVTLKWEVNLNYGSHGAQLGFVLVGILGQDGILNWFTSSSIVTAVPVFTVLKVCSYVMLICNGICQRLEAHLRVTAKCTEMSGSLVNFKGGITTMSITLCRLQQNVLKCQQYEHNTVQEIGQLTTGLGVDVLKGFRGKIFFFGANYLLMVTQILQVLAWLDFLKWKFKLHSTKVCSVINVRVDNIFISVGCIDINRKYKSNWFCEGKVHNQIAPTLRRSDMFLSSTLWLLTELPKTPVCTGYGRLLFDRGKILDSVVMPLCKHRSSRFQDPMYLPGKCQGCYGYLRWKFRFVPRGFWSVRSVKMTVQFTVFSLNRKWTSHSKSFGVVYVVEVIPEYSRNRGNTEVLRTNDKAGYQASSGAVYGVSCLLKMTQEVKLIG